MKVILTALLTSFLCYAQAMSYDCERGLQVAREADSAWQVALLPEAVQQNCVEMVRYLLGAGVDPNAFGRQDIGMTPLCLSYYALHDASEIEDEVLREAELAAAREIRDMLLSYGAICDMSLSDRQVFIYRFAEFQTNITENTVIAYIQDGQVLLLQGETQTVVDVVGSKIKDFEEWISRNTWLQAADIAVIGISANHDDRDVLRGFKLGAERCGISVCGFYESSWQFVCDIPALLQLFQTHRWEQIRENTTALLDTVCPPQGPISRIPTAMVEKLNAL